MRNPNVSAFTGMSYDIIWFDDTFTDVLVSFHVYRHGTAFSWRPACQIPGVHISYPILGCISKSSQVSIIFPDPSVSLSTSPAISLGSAILHTSTDVHDYIHVQSHDTALYTPPSLNKIPSSTLGRPGFQSRRSLIIDQWPPPSSKPESASHYSMTENSPTGDLICSRHTSY